MLDLTEAPKGQIRSIDDPTILTIGFIPGHKWSAMTLINGIFVQWYQNRPLFALYLNISLNILTELCSSTVVSSFLSKVKSRRNPNCINSINLVVAGPNNPLIIIIVGFIDYRFIFIDTNPLMRLSPRRDSRGTDMG